MALRIRACQRTYPIFGIIGGHGRRPESFGGGRYELANIAKWPHINPHSYNAGKKIKRKKRHIIADTQGLLMHAIVHQRRNR
jgi:hypothetical protein